MHQKEVADVFKELEVNEKGLTSHQAEERLHKYGFNELKVKKKIHAWQIFLSQFSSPLVWILIVALVISIFLHETIDAAVIGIIIIVNAILGFVQEFKAEKAIDALKRMASPKAHVLRNEKKVLIESKFVVPGDIIILEEGNKIPADSRIFELHSLRTSEGPLTGESQPVTKIVGVLPEKTLLADRKNMVYSSTVITAGKGRAVVTSTGMKTEVGKIATLITDAEEKLTPLQKKLRTLGKHLTVAVVLVAILVFVTGVLTGKPASVMFLTAIALAVAAIPEGLPAVITISLAIGVQRMVKKNALVRKLPSVETLGSVSIICTDKTGTLTHNEMTVKKIWANSQIYKVSGAGYNPHGKFTSDGKQVDSHSLATLLKIGFLCNDAALNKNGAKWEVIGDPTEAALVVSAEKAGFIHEELKKQEKRVDEIPFSSARKMMSTFHKVGKKTLSYTKGAPDVLIDKCDRISINGKVQRLNRHMKKEILKQNELFASEALRVLGFAYNDHYQKKEDAEQSMVFVGLQAMIDPPRKEVKDAIVRCKDACIRVMMITGDQVATAKAIAAELGITGEAVTGAELQELKDFGTKVEKTGIFARVNPEHKLAIVEALEKKGYVVAMTGDGVNDAPALKKAHIGVAMGISGTDVAKEASDMILTDDNFTSIVNAVEEGRGIFDNIRKFINYLLSSNLGEISVILFASLFGLPLPLTAIQILWVNLVTDGLPATALSFDSHTDGIMKKKPRPSKEGILSPAIRSDILIFGVLIGIFCMILFWLYQGSGLMKAQTVVFTSIVLFEVVRLYSIRGAYGLSLFSNKLLTGAVALSLGLQLVVLYTPLSSWFKTAPLGIMDWGVMIVASAGILGVYKLILFLFGKKVHS